MQNVSHWPKRIVCRWVQEQHVGAFYVRLHVRYREPPAFSASMEMASPLVDVQGLEP